MTHPPSPHRPEDANDDPLIAEVRKRREEVSAAFGHDLDRLCDHLRELEREYADRMVIPKRDEEVRRKSA